MSKQKKDKIYILQPYSKQQLNKYLAIIIITLIKHTSSVPSETWV